MALDAASGVAEGSAAEPETLYRSDRTGVWRVPLPGGGTAIRKETRGRDAVARVRHEASVLERLAGVPGVPGLIERDPAGTSMLLTDSAGTVLADSARGIDPRRVVGFARSLAEIVAAVHRRGVIHKDINPSNVVVADEWQATLVDFDLATTFAEERPVFTHHSEVAGTLPYLAPEQTGRTGWPVDHRADLYALGATLYELLTGHPPFGADTDEPLRLIHAHLARTARPPSALNHAIPEPLSAIVLRLLEKEPDQRYQSADGLAHDLARLAERWDAGETSSVEGFALGDRDFPLRLTAPSRLVGRDAEKVALAAAYDGVRSGASRGLLVSGAPGVGKSALLDELRPLVTEHGGWLVTGKFDQYSQDAATDGLRQAFTALGRLLLAEPEGKLVGHRERLLASLGSNAGVVAVWPEFATLLGVEHEPPQGDAAEVQLRIHRSCADLLRAVGTPERPVVMVLDDLQWAGGFPIGTIDALLTDADLPGVLVVGAYRDAEVDAAHPLTPMLDRWTRLGLTPDRLALDNLPPAALATLLAEMLRLDADDATSLADAIGARTRGNPFDTVELVNALRRDDALVHDETGWRWDPDTIRRFVGSNDVLHLLTTRIEHLPAQTAALLEVMACLSGDITPDLLATAADLTDNDVHHQLAPALEDGLLVAVTTAPTQIGTTARFRHDRVQQAAHDHLPTAARERLHLTLARRLAASAAWTRFAAEQYLRAAAVLSDPAEARRAADLFLAAGARLKLVDAVMAERYLAAATTLLTTDDPRARDVRVALHEVLCTLGRADDAERVYLAIAEHCTDPVELAGPAAVRIGSLWVSGRMQDGLAFGLQTLRELGLDLPAPDDLGAEIPQGLTELRDWVERDDLAGDLIRPEIGDPRWVAIADVIHRVLPLAFGCDESAMAWLVLRARRMWAELGPCQHLVGPLAWTGMLMIAAADDYRTGHRAVQRVLAVAEARGYEPMTSQARYVHGINNALWFEPLEDVVALAYRSRERFLRLGDLAHAVFTYVGALPLVFEFAPTLDQFLADADAGMAFSTRIGNTAALETLRSIAQLGRALRGETSAPGSFTDDVFDETAYLAAMAPFTVPRGHFHAHRALSALVFRDGPAMAHHARAGMDLVRQTPGAFCTVKAHLVHGLAAAFRLRGDPLSDGPPPTSEEAERLLSELDACRDWLAGRAADAPANFGRLTVLLDAERAWAVGDHWAAATAFDAALSELGQHSHPWQQALIAERAALFHLDHGLPSAGSRWLAEAHHRYAAWGAIGKVRLLEEEYPFLRDEAGWTVSSSASVGAHGAMSTRTSRTSSESIDLVGVLRAAQALGSETNLDRLRGRVVEVLTLMTGATNVALAQWKDDAGDWFVPADPARDEGSGEGVGQLVTVAEAARRGLVPLSAFRYAERTGEPLRVDDATRDDRFARDPYLAGLERCSMLLVPIASHGRMRAMLVLENRLSRGAFTADRLDAVLLIAGQLAVCLDNALAERFRSLVQRSSELTLVCDRAGVVSYASTAATELLGREPTALVGRPVTDVVAEDERWRLLEWVSRGGATTDEALVCRPDTTTRAGGDGEERWVEATLTDLSADPAVGGLMLRLRDVTERRRLEQALEELATTDPLTGLANRRRFDERLRHEAERSVRTGSALTLLMLDIDHFKSVNDTRGHPVGDILLKAVAGQCRTTVRNIDLVARVGGEEFAVLLVDLALHEGEWVADRMRKVVESTVVHLTHQPPLACTVSIGVAQFAGDPDELVSRADAVLYRAKAEGRNRVCVAT